MRNIPGVVPLFISHAITGKRQWWTSCSSTLPTSPCWTASNVPLLALPALWVPWTSSPLFSPPFHPKPDTEIRNIRDLGLNDAARAARKEVVEFLLDHGGSPNAVDMSTNTALSWTAFNCDFRVMKSLLLHRCTLNPKDADGRTPLYDAIQSGANDCVRLLVMAGADLNCETKSGLTPLNEAVYWAKPMLVQLLLDGGAKMRLSPSREDHYDSVLTFALRSSSEQVVRVLLDFYAKGRGEKSVKPSTALDLVWDHKPGAIPALLESWPQTKEYLRRHGKKAVTNFYSIASKGSVETLTAVLGVIDKSSINSFSQKTGTLLHAAMCGGGNDIEQKVNVLIDHDADPSIICGSYGTTVNAAAYFHLQEVVKLLLERLPESMHPRLFICIAGVEGNPIHAAVKGLKNAKSAKAAVELLEFLRWKQAPLTDSLLINGENPLHAAARVSTRWYSKDAVKWLLKNGVDPDSSDKAGRRPMHLAIHTGDIDLVKLLLTDKTTLETLDHQKMHGLHYATQSKSSEMTSRLVDLYRGEDHEKDILSFIEAQDVDRWTPLHWACRQTDLDIVSYLIDNCKANANAETKIGWTPWHVAVYHGIKNRAYLKLLSELPLQERNDFLPNGALKSSGSCDICNANIFGDRYRCEALDCYNLDMGPNSVFSMCWKCHGNHISFAALHLREHTLSTIDD